jgi:mxaJ protein
MFSRCLSGLLLALSALGADTRVLRVCADPNNLPFSNQAREGFENHLAEMIARDLGARLEYTWWAQRKSFVKNSLDAGRCDVLLGVPANLPSVEATKPYYRSTYVFVSRRDSGLHVSSLNDPKLEKLRIGVQMVGENYAPPAQVLARRNLTANIVGYSLFGKNGEANPPARIIEAVAHGDIDIAIVWGPFAGFFAKSQSSALESTPVSPAAYMGIPFAYEISAAVRTGDDQLRAQIDRALGHECAAIQALLSEYGVPQTPEGRLPCVSPRSDSVSLR